MTAPGAVVIDTTAPLEPKVLSTANVTTKPVIKGKWAEKIGNTLRVVASGKVFILGRDKQLSSDGQGNWTLLLSSPLADGNHSILAESSDPFGNLSRTAVPKVVMVDTTKPNQPTIEKQKINTDRPNIVGTWPEDGQNTLAVKVDDTTYKLGADNQIASDGKGNWTVTPANQLSQGYHSVKAMATDTGPSTVFVSDL